MPSEPCRSVQPRRRKAESEPSSGSPVGASSCAPNYDGGRPAIRTLAVARGQPSRSFVQFIVSLGRTAAEPTNHYSGRLHNSVSGSDNNGSDNNGSGSAGSRRHPQRPLVAGRPLLRRCSGGARSASERREPTTAEHGTPPLRPPPPNERGHFGAIGGF